MEGTNEQLYIDVFTLRSFAHINQVAILYETTYGTSLTTVVTTEFAIDMGNALSTIRMTYTNIIKPELINDFF